MRGSIGKRTIPLIEASQFVQMAERRQDLKIACPEEIAFWLGFTDALQLERLGNARGFFFESFSRRFFAELTDCSADLLYKTTDYYASDWERTILWNDPAVSTEWPVECKLQLSAKHEVGKLLHYADVFP